MTQIRSSRVLILLCKILQLCGLWKPYDSAKITRILYNIFSVIFLFVFSGLYTFFMCANLIFLDDIKDLTNRLLIYSFILLSVPAFQPIYLFFILIFSLKYFCRLFMSLAEFALLIKVINLYWTNRSCQRMRDLFQTFPVESSEEAHILNNSNQTFGKLLFLYFLVSNMSTTISFIMTALSDGYNLAYSGWYPLDWQHNLRDYWIVFLYQYCGMTITSNLNISTDLYFCYNMHMMRVEIGVFGDRLEQSKAATTQEVKSYLIRHYTTHQHIMECINEIRCGVRIPYFVQILLSSIVISSLTIETAYVIQRIQN